jgi:hypothetical protein
MYLRKDQSLDALAEKGNVAQFVSFVPHASGPQQAYAHAWPEPIPISSTP